MSDHQHIHRDEDDSRITAYALGELDAADEAAFEQALAASGSARGELEAIRDVAQRLSDALQTAEPSLVLTPQQRARIEQALAERNGRAAAATSLGTFNLAAERRRISSRRSRWYGIATAALAASVALGFALPLFLSHRAENESVAFELPPAMGDEDAIGGDFAQRGGQAAGTDDFRGDAALDERRQNRGDTPASESLARPAPPAARNAAEEAGEGEDPATRARRGGHAEEGAGRELQRGPTDGTRGQSDAEAAAEAIGTDRADHEADSPPPAQDLPGERLRTLDQLRDRSISAPQAKEVVVDRLREEEVLHLTQTESTPRFPGGGGGGGGGAGFGGAGRDPGAHETSTLRIAEVSGGYERARAIIIEGRDASQASLIDPQDFINAFLEDRWPAFARGEAGEPEPAQGQRQRRSHIAVEPLTVDAELAECPWDREQVLLLLTISNATEAEGGEPIAGAAAEIVFNPAIVEAAELVGDRAAAQPGEGGEAPAIAPLPVGGVLGAMYQVSMREAPGEDDAADHRFEDGTLCIVRVRPAAAADADDAASRFGDGSPEALRVAPEVAPFERASERFQRAAAAAAIALILADAARAEEGIDPEVAETLLQHIDEAAAQELRQLLEAVSARSAEEPASPRD